MPNKNQIGVKPNAVKVKEKMEMMDTGGNKILKRGKKESVTVTAKDNQEIGGEKFKESKDGADVEKYKDTDGEERLKEEEERKSLSRRVVVILSATAHRVSPLLRRKTQIPSFYAALFCLFLGVILGKGKKDLVFKKP